MGGGCRLRSSEQQPAHGGRTGAAHIHSPRPASSSARLPLPPARAARPPRPPAPPASAGRGAWRAGRHTPARPSSRGPRTESDESMGKEMRAWRRRRWRGGGPAARRRRRQRCHARPPTGRRALHQQAAWSDLQQRGDGLARGRNVLRHARRLLHSQQRVQRLLAPARGGRRASSRHVGLHLCCVQGLGRALALQLRLQVLGVAAHVGRVLGGAHGDACWQKRGCRRAVGWAGSGGWRRVEAAAHRTAPAALRGSEAAPGDLWQRPRPIWCLQAACEQASAAWRPKREVAPHLACSGLARSLCRIGQESWETLLGGQGPAGAFGKPD